MANNFLPKWENLSTEVAERISQDFVPTSFLTIWHEQKAGWDNCKSQPAAGRPLDETT